MAGSTPYEYDKFVPYKYNTTMIEDGKEMLIPALLSIVNIVDVSGVTRNGRVFAVAASKRTEDMVIEKSNTEKTLVVQARKSSIVNRNSN